MKKKIIKTLLILLVVIISFVAGFTTSEYRWKKNRPIRASMAAFSGTCAYQKKDIPEALEDLYAAVYLDPSNSDAHLGLGSLFYEQGLYDLSLHEYGKYLQNPTNGMLTIFSEKKYKQQSERMVKRDVAWVYCYIGDIYEKKGDKSKSIENYGKAQKSDPDFKKYIETYIKFINDMKVKEPRHIKKLELLTKTLTRIKEAEKGT
ncbi:MAG: tetratricopeptide repeat protein [Thermodesulfovibrionales bacterium]